MERARAALVVIILALTCGSAGCRSLPEDRGSAFAAASGNRTVILGGCEIPEIGWKVCHAERGGTLPNLVIHFVNEGSYAVSDCFNGLAWHGPATAGQTIEIPLSSIKDQVESLGFCLLKVDTSERWADGRSIPLVGGFVIELLTPGYLPTPPRGAVAFCRKFGRTTAGRTTSEPCDR